MGYMSLLVVKGGTLRAEQLAELTLARATGRLIKGTVGVLINE